MSLEAKAPVLIGEWFLLRVRLTNGEAEALTDITVVARLKDAADPIIARSSRMIILC